MDDTTLDLEFFRNELNRQREEILGDSEITLHEMQEESTLFPDPSDRATLESDHITVLRIRDRQNKLLGKIQEALDRIENGTFGECEECGGPIGSKRLSIRPVTTLCINCKEEQEEEENIRKSKKS
ncbi:MAG: RNA polymerase-binding protein DksA [SAR324 cluster bacterium]|nr:RNA polymerase-binding protein DksA [SAR324 cluster bacterium]MBF0353413.1 RNA polymerase-binding protein DksA [SAR324 cluster bacterium]